MFSSFENNGNMVSIELVEHQFDQMYPQADEATKIQLKCWLLYCQSMAAGGRPSVPFEVFASKLSLVDVLTLIRGYCIDCSDVGGVENAVSVITKWYSEHENNFKSKGGMNSMVNSRLRSDLEEFCAGVRRFSNQPLESVSFQDFLKFYSEYKMLIAGLDFKELPTLLVKLGYNHYTAKNLAQEITRLAAEFFSLKVRILAVLDKD